MKIQNSEILYCSDPETCHLIDHVNQVLTQQVLDTKITPRTQSQQVTVQKGNISVQIVHSIVATHGTKVTKQKYTSLLCIYYLWTF